MIPPLSPELEQKIEEEATEAATILAWSQHELDKDNAYSFPKVDPIRKAFFKKGAIPYAELWQAVEQRAERYEKALRDILNPIGYLQAKAEEEGGKLDGNQALQLANNVSFIQGIAREALTSKTIGDEK